MLIATKIWLKLTQKKKKIEHYELKALVTHGFMLLAGENIHNNFTRLVIVVWLFVVLILTSSYTASLSSMLTVQQLQSNDIEWLKNNNLKVSIKKKKLESWL